MTPRFGISFQDQRAMWERRKNILKNHPEVDKLIFIWECEYKMKEGKTKDLTIGIAKQGFSIRESFRGAGTALAWC